MPLNSPRYNLHLDRGSPRAGGWNAKHVGRAGGARWGERAFHGPLGRFPPLRGRNRKNVCGALRGRPVQGTAGPAPHSIFPAIRGVRERGLPAAPQRPEVRKLPICNGREVQTQLEPHLNPFSSHLCLPNCAGGQPRPPSLPCPSSATSLANTATPGCRKPRLPRPDTACKPTLLRVSWVLRDPWTEPRGAWCWVITGKRPSLLSAVMLHQFLLTS